MRELCKYYDKKACLNLKHSEVIIDVFRFCIRKDPDLFTYLEKRIVSRETFQFRESEAAQTNLESTTIPKPSMMEVDTQSNLDMLLKKEVVVTEFERTLDNLQGDGQNLLAEFVDWQAAGPMAA